MDVNNKASLIHRLWHGNGCLTLDYSPLKMNSKCLLEKQTEFNLIVIYRPFL